MRPSIIRYAIVNIDELFKPMCANCTYFLKEPSSEGTFSRSRCQKILVNPENNIYSKDTKIKGDYIEKHPYAIFARFDITMCGLNGTYFTPANK